MKKVSIIMTSFLFLFSYCKKRPDHSPINNNQNDQEENLEIIWQKPLNSSLENVLSIEPILFENQIITSSDQDASNEKILSFNKVNGEENWSWDDYIMSSNQFLEKDQSILIDNALIVCSWHDNYAINLDNGMTTWGTYLEFGSPRISSFNSIVYHAINYGNLPQSDSSKIVMCNYNEGNWLDVITLSDLPESVILHPPATYVNSNLDTLLIFQNRGGSINPFYENVDLYCYNLSLDSILWIKPNFTSSGSSNVRIPIVQDGFIYFAGKFDFICVEIESGEEIWRHNFYWDYQGSNYLIYNDLIITNLDNGDLIAINKHSGNQVWVNEGLSGCCVELRVFENRIYFGNDKLYIVNANNGELLHKLSPPNPGGSFRNAIAVDLPNQKMYTSDGKYIMCMELPE